LVQVDRPSSVTRPKPPVPDIEPFNIEPIILGRLYRAGVHPSVVGMVSIVATAIAVSWSALLSNLFYRSPGSLEGWRAVWSFLLRNPTNSVARSMPYLSDYPAIVLTATIAVSIYLVYELFYSASVLHSDMGKASCIRYTEQGRKALSDAVDEMNAKFLKWGKAAPLALLLALVCTTLINLRLKGRLYGFLRNEHLYTSWWASLSPLRPGGVVWLLFGGLGIYIVYTEAVLGLTYLAFLRKCRGDYQFRANMVNPDGLYGWSRVRRIVSNLEAGVLCTLLSAWALWFYLQPAVGSVVTVLVIGIFVGIVLYVFIGVTASYRRQVKTDKYTQRAEIGEEIANNSDGDSRDLLKVMIAYQRLAVVEKIPSVPIRPAWLVAGAVTLIGPVSAIIVQLLKFFMTK
jgi:hypothetical protein